VGADLHPRPARDRHRDLELTRSGSIEDVELPARANGATP